MALVGNTITKGVAHDDPSFASFQVRGNAGFYGVVPVVQRTFVASLHNSTAMVSSAGSLFQATHVAQIQEIMNTLTGLGIWATA